MGIVTKSLLLFNTVRYLKLSQMINQVMVRLRSKEKFWKYGKKGASFTDYDLWIEELDGSPEFVERFNPEALLTGRLTLLNEIRTFNQWNFNDASHLWNFNVHYLEYLVPLAAKRRSLGEEKYKVRINEILEDWYKNGSEEADSNQAYTISLRIVNQLIIASCVDDKQRLYDAIYAQYQFLLNHQEKHLLGNHYLENLKAIVICSVVFDEGSVYKKYVKKLVKELSEEITNDGLHFELSLMYHKIVLEDLIRVAVVLKQAGKAEFDDVVKHIKNMAVALYSLEFGIKRTPLFNDAANNVAKPSQSLLNACESLFLVKPSKVEQIAGYQKLYDGKITIIEDCGDLSPRYMPGHGHCDCLSFELFFDGQPIFVNSGTYQYQGSYRRYFRSTSAHNTVVINCHEQSELWGEHRAGRRIRSIKCERRGNAVIGEYKNYYGEKHRRLLQIKDSKLSVIDVTEGGGVTQSFLHLAPGLSFNEGKIEGFGLEISVLPINAEMRVEDSIYSQDMGIKKANFCLVFSWQADNCEHGYNINIKEIKYDD